jgi:hypothetical protein
MAAVVPMLPLGVQIADKDGKITTPWSFYFTSLQNTIVPVGGPVVSFNTRTGNVTLLDTDIFSALHYIPVDPAHAVLTGTPTAPTAANGTNDTQIATTAFVLANTSLQGYGTGSASDEVFFLNSQTVTNSFTIPTNFNASSVGPISIVSGVVTVPPGSTWIIEGIQSGGGVISFNARYGNIVTTAADLRTINTITTKTAAYLVLASDFTILADATSASFIIRLPAYPSLNELHNIKKIDSTAHTVTITGNGKLIDGGASAVIKYQYTSVELQYNGTYWSVI